MNIIKILKNDKFLKIYQFEKRRILENYILNYEQCKVGLNVICFETETIVKENYKYFYHKSKVKKRCKLTIGKSYIIADYNYGSVKIKNDDDKYCWFTLNRFLYSVKIERQIKLDKIKKLYNDV